MYIELRTRIWRSPSCLSVCVKLPFKNVKSKSMYDNDPSSQLILSHECEYSQIRDEFERSQEFFDKAIALSDATVDEIRSSVDNLVISNLAWLDYNYKDGSYTELRINAGLVCLHFGWSNNAAEGWKSVEKLSRALLKASREYGVLKPGQDSDLAIR